MTYVDHSDTTAQILTALLLIFLSFQGACFLANIETATMLLFHANFTFCSILFAYKIDQLIGNTTSFCVLMLMIISEVMYVITISLMKFVPNANTIKVLGIYALLTCDCCTSEQHRREDTNEMRGSNYEELAPELEPQYVNPTDVCSICLVEYGPHAELNGGDELDAAQLRCRHLFHQSCIDKWLQNHDTCPICRAEN